MKRLSQPVLNTGLLAPIMATLVITGCQQPDDSHKLKPTLDKLVQVWNTGNLEELDALIDPQFVRHANPATSLEGLDALKKLVSGFRTAYPDLKLVLDDEIYAGDKIAGRWTFTGTNTGPGDMPPTGKPVTLWGISILRIANGKIVEEWVGFDNQSLMEQLGFTMIPPSGETK